MWSSQVVKEENFHHFKKDNVVCLECLTSWLLHFSRLYDGRVLCELMNELEEGAVPQEVGQMLANFMN